MSQKFLLCFHDFSVWNYKKLMPILDSLKSLAGEPFSILVIPCVDGASEEHVAGFKVALSILQQEGYELALHGFKHKAEFSQGRSYGGLMAMNLTGGEAEFAGLSEYESSRLLHEGLQAWKILMGEDCAPKAFVPPTWYGNRFLTRQVRAEHMLYEGRCMLINEKGKTYVSPVASFAGIPKTAEKMSVVFGRIMLDAPVVIPRIALHPGDFPHLEGEIRDLIRVALNNKRKLVHYSDL